MFAGIKTEWQIPEFMKNPTSLKSDADVGFDSQADSFFGGSNSNVEQQSLGVSTNCFSIKYSSEFYELVKDMKVVIMVNGIIVYSDLIL